MKLGNVEFTDKEWEILMDRPDDCLLDVFCGISSGDPDDEIYDPTDVQYVLDCIRSGDWKSAVNHMDVASNEILADMVNGSTWACSFWFEYDQGVAGATLKYRNVLKIGEALAEKVATLTGEEIEFPAG